MLVGAPGAYRLGKPLDSLQVPATVQAVSGRAHRSAARRGEAPPPDAPPSSARRCPCRCCRPSPSCPRRCCIAGLAHLQAAEFLYETRLFPEHEYTFKHALTHEVAYSSLLQSGGGRSMPALLRPSRRSARDRVAEQVERLAHHALRGEVWDKALAYCRQAGEKVEARSAHREAVGYFEQALSSPRASAGDARHPRAGHRSPARPAHGALAVWATSGGCWRVCARPRPSPTALDDPRRLGQVSIFLAHHFYTDGRV